MKLRKNVEIYINWTEKIVNIKQIYFKELNNRIRFMTIKIDTYNKGLIICINFNMVNSYE